MSDLEALDLAAIGPPIENAAIFPNRTNVSFWTELAPDRIRARIFERGVGETLSSGTGACGAAVAHVLRGGDSPVTVELDGGELTVDVDESLHVDLEGWAVPVFRGEVELAWRADDRGLGQRTGDADRRRAGARRALPGPAARPRRRARRAGHDRARGRAERRAARRRTVTVADRARRPRAAPTDAYDAYLRLHLLSHRLVKPHGLSLEGVFGVLPNVAWTSHGPVDPAALAEVRMRFRARRRAAAGLLASTSSRA